MADVRRNFIFPSDPQNAPADMRAANALEFIAHYLDRIDGHLEALVAQARGGNGETAKIAQQLMSINQFVGRIAVK